MFFKIVILAEHLAHSCNLFFKTFQLGQKMVRRWVTARKSVAGPGPVIRFRVPDEVDFGSWFVDSFV